MVASLMRRGSKFFSVVVLVCLLWTPVAAAASDNEPQAPDTAPAPPTNVTATAISPSKIRVTWTDNSNDETGFHVSDGERQITVWGTSSYVWDRLAGGTYKCIRVQSYHLAGASSWSPWSCATTPSEVAAPTGVTATAISTSEIRVNWTDASTNEIGFWVKDGVRTETVGANATSYIWRGLEPGTYKCSYVAAFVSGESWSQWSAQVCVTTPTLPAAPTGVTATAISSSAIRVNWVDASIDEAGFRVSDGIVTNPVGANTTTFVWGGLAPGTYKCFRIHAHNPWGSSSSNEACTTTHTVPAAPTGLSATAISGGEIRLTWTDNSNNEDGFWVTDGAATQTAGANATSYVWSGLAQGSTKCFVVRSYNTVGASPWSAQACAATPTVPAPPTGVAATVVSGSEVRVTWSDNSHNEQGFRVSNGSVTRPVDANVAAYVWTGLAHGSTTCFSVQSHNLAGPSSWPPATCATTPTVPAAPSGLTATAISGTQIQVNWSDNSDNETGFRLLANGNVLTRDANVVSFLWGGLAPGSTTCFAVQSFNLAGASQLTPEVCTTTPTVPAAPTGMAVAAISGSAIQVTWSDRSNNETGFRVSDGVTTATVGPNTGWLVSSGLAPGTTRCFSVQAYNLAGSSAWTPEVCATTPTVPAAPTDVTATAISGSEIRVTWTDNSPNETGFRVSDGVTTTTVDANATSYVWTGIAQGTTKCFSVVSYNLAGSISWTVRPVCATTPTVPAAPTGLTVTAISASEIRVTWADNSNNEDGFRIASGAGGKATVPANTTSFIWGGFLPGSTGCFAVDSYNLAGSSPSTPFACAITDGGRK